MTKIISWFDGKKTYFLAACIVAYAVGGLVTGHLSPKEAIDLLFGSGVAATLRNAIS